MEWKIYHNPKCSKSRQTLEILQNKGVQVEVIEYLKTGLSLKEIEDLSVYLNLPVSSFIRKKENLFKELNLAHASEEELKQALEKNSSLLERPIVVREEKAVIGRPPENVNRLF